MFRLSHHGVLLLLSALIAASAARAAATDDVQTNRSLSIPERPSPAPSTRTNAGKTSGETYPPARGDNSTQRAVPPANTTTDAPAGSAPASPSAGTGSRADASPVRDGSATPATPRSSDLSTLPARERMPLGPADATAGDRQDLAADGTDRSWVLQTLAALGVVIALIFVLRAFLQRMGGHTAGPSGSGLVEVVARTGIGPRTQVLFLRINQRVIVVAQSSSGLQTLTELNDPEEVAWLLGRVESAKPLSISQGFRHLMQRAERDYNRDDPAAPEEGADEQEQYVDRTRSQLSGLLSHIRTLKQRAP